jgi:hypothetical protein
MNRFKNYVLMAAGFAVLAMVVGVFSVGPAIAQAVRAALVSNVDDPGRIPYHSSQLCGFSGSRFCVANFPVVPAGKRLVITHVSGFVVEAGLPGGSLIRPQIDDTYILVTFTGDEGGSSNFVFEQSALLFYDTGLSPHALITVSPIPTSGFGQFTLAGYMLDCSTGPCAAIVP